MFILVIIEASQHDFVSHRETLNLLLKKSITTTDEPPRDSNFINSNNIHNNSNKSSAVNITNDDRDFNSNSVTETNRIETNKSESSNGDSNSNKSGRWDGNANKKAQSKNVCKKMKSKVRRMENYTKPCTREENQDHIILHVGTKDLISDNIVRSELENQLST